MILAYINSLGPGTTRRLARKGLKARVVHLGQIRLSGFARVAVRGFCQVISMRTIQGQLEDYYDYESKSDPLRQLLSDPSKHAAVPPAKDSHERIVRNKNSMSAHLNPTTVHTNPQRAQHGMGGAPLTSVAQSTKTSGCPVHCFRKSTEDLAKGWEQAKLMSWHCKSICSAVGWQTKPITTMQGLTRELTY